MNCWVVAIVLLLPPLLVPLVVAVRANSNNRLIAVQLAGTLASFILAIMTFAFDQSSFIDIALCLTLLSIPGTYFYTVFMERWF